MAEKAARKRRAKKQVKQADFIVRCRFSDTDQEFEINLTDLTIEEKILVEDYFDAPWNHLLGEGWLNSAKGTAFFSYLARRRVEEGFSYPDAVKFNPKIIDRDAARPTNGSRTTGSQG